MLVAKRVLCEPDAARDKFANVTSAIPTLNHFSYPRAEEEELDSTKRGIMSAFVFLMR